MPLFTGQLDTSSAYPGNIVIGLDAIPVNVAMALADSTMTGQVVIIATASGASLASAVGRSLNPTSASASGSSTAIGRAGSIAAASGNSTAGFVGLSINTAIASATGDGTAGFVGFAVNVAIANASADCAAGFVGFSINVAIANAPGDSTAICRTASGVTGAGDSSADGVGDYFFPGTIAVASGISSAGGTGASVFASIGGGIAGSSANGVGAHIFASTGSASGGSSASGMRALISISTGAASGTSIGDAGSGTRGFGRGDSSATAIGSGIFVLAGRAFGDSASNSVGSCIFQGVGAISGASVVGAIGQSTVAVSWLADGDSNAVGQLGCLAMAGGDSNAIGRMGCLGVAGGDGNGIAVGASHNAAKGISFAYGVTGAVNGSVSINRYWVGNIVFDVCGNDLEVIDTPRRNFYSVRDEDGNVLLVNIRSIFPNRLTSVLDYTETLEIEKICAVDRFNQKRGCAYLPRGTIVMRRRTC